MFNSIFADGITFYGLILSIFISICLGLFISYIHMKTTSYTKNFVITLTILPVLVELVMIMVNGNLGTSVAVLGAFSLVRFRSLPGNSREITSIFFAMGIGLAMGMGEVVVAILMTLIIGGVLFILSKSHFGSLDNSEQILKITIPENLDYMEVFDDLFKKYTKKIDLYSVKTTNMGSMYELAYKVILNDYMESKKFIDDLRVRNGNLKITLSKPVEGELL